MFGALLGRLPLLLLCEACLPISTLPMMQVKGGATELARKESGFAKLALGWLLLVLLVAEVLE